MELDQASGGSSGAPNQRKERGAIAAQACDVCRSRKQKCDEKQPKCTLCQRMNIECRYREPQPTKKDNTLVEILDRLTSLEGKVNRLGPARSTPRGFGPPQPSPSSQPSFNTDIDDAASFLLSQPISEQPGLSSMEKNQPYRHGSGSLKMLLWPAIQQLLMQSLATNVVELRSLERDGSVFLSSLCEGESSLPLNDTLQERPFTGMQSQATRNAGGTRMTFPALTYNKIYQLATIYFDTFNIFYPLLDRETFFSDILTRVHSEGFAGDTDSVIALLVFALGEVALEESLGDPIEIYKGRSSGIRGGSATKPPGLALFNEARKRIGFVLTECELENVQIFSLAALYYECSFRHADFWRMAVTASEACLPLITCKTIDWTSQRGELIKQVYWHCTTMRIALHLELDIKTNGLTALEYQVGMPSFNAAFNELDHGGNQASYFQAYYASQVALWRLCYDLRVTIDEAMSSNLNTPLSSNNDSFTGSTTSYLKQVSAKLAQWRRLLPQDLQWPDDDPLSYSTPELASPDSFNQSLDPSLSPAADFAQFMANTEPTYYPYVYDVQVALLRTRYYYSKYVLHQPFVYKVLHFPEQVTEDDARGVAECLRSCLRWPIVLSPTSRRKRLIPYLFSWSQAFLSILLVLRLTRHNPVLRDIRAQFCGPAFEAEVNQTIDAMIDWIRDLRGCDSIAMWCWNILQGVYALDDPEGGESPAE